MEMIRIHKLDSKRNSFYYPALLIQRIKLFTPYELIVGHTSGLPPEKLFKEKTVITRYNSDINTKISHYL